MPRKKIQATGVLAERVDRQGKRRLSLANAEREELRQRELVERAVAMYLDITQDHTQVEIAQELGISLEALKNLTRSEAFNDVYNQHFLELGHDPRLKASQAAIVDLLPQATRTLKNLLNGADTPAGVKLKAIENIFKFGGIDQPKPAANDKKELAEFLVKSGLDIQNLNVYTGLPLEFTDPLAFSRDRGETLEATVREVPELPA